LSLETLSWLEKVNQKTSVSIEVTTTSLRFRPELDTLESREVLDVTPTYLCIILVPPAGDESALSYSTIEVFTESTTEPKTPIKDAPKDSTIDKVKNSGDMLKSAYELINTYDGNAQDKGSFFKDVVVPQIKKAYPGWDVAFEDTGKDKSKIFIGDRGSAVIIAPDGSIYTGKVGDEGLPLAKPGELQPVYDKLTKH
jgi:hypothetical protein